MRGKTPKAERAQRERVVAEENARAGRALDELAGRRAWETWCSRADQASVPTQPESEWLALGGLLS